MQLYFQPVFGFISLFGIKNPVPVTTVDMFKIVLGVCKNLQSRIKPIDAPMAKRPLPKFLDAR